LRAASTTAHFAHTQLLPPELAHRFLKRNTAPGGQALLAPRNQVFGRRAEVIPKIRFSLCWQRRQELSHCLLKWNPPARLQVGLPTQQLRLPLWANVVPKIGLGGRRFGLSLQQRRYSSQKHGVFHALDQLVNNLPYNGQIGRSTRSGNVRGHGVNMKSVLHKLRPPRPPRNPPRAKTMSQRTSTKPNK